LVANARKMTIGVKCEVNIKKWGKGSCFCSFIYLFFVVYVKKKS
jgi:hypothetical protein